MSKTEAQYTNAIIALLDACLEKESFLFERPRGITHVFKNTQMCEEMWDAIMDFRKEIVKKLKKSGMKVKNSCVRDKSNVQFEWIPLPAPMLNIAVEGRVIRYRVTVFSRKKYILLSINRVEAKAQYDFEGKQKGYKIENMDQLRRVVDTVRNSGFKDTFVFQEYIEGSDDSMFVYTAYVNSHHKVTAMTGGRILMHDRTPELIGNYNAITNACDTALCEKLKYFLEHIDFTGTCHFDVQYDAKRQGYVVFEMNIRQGRSNYYTAASGVNLAKLIVEDYLYHKETPFFIAKRSFTVSVVPKLMLKLALKSSGEKSYKMKNFYRFGLAPYDRGLKRYIYQMAWDLRTMKNHFKYNR